MMPQPFEAPYAWIKRVRGIPKLSYRRSLYLLQKRQVIKISEKNGKKFIQLTGKGQLETLLADVLYKKSAAWDGKWRLILFDIPEGARAKRDHLRYLLLSKGFEPLQKSVFISPHPLSRGAIEYLKKTRLIDYIRVIRADRMDEDFDLRKKFKLVRA